jgi:hypothetical protein
MGKLTEHERNELREYLIAQGLSFKPLRDEMFDHITSDLEERLSNGESFHEAWSHCIGEIPKDHFQLIQNDVMETINKGFTLTQWFSFSALTLLFVSTVFKVLHLQFAGEVLLLSFVLIITSLLTTTVKGIFLNKGKKGAVKLLAVIIGVILLLIAYGFKVLHLAGADFIILTAVMVLIISLIVNTVHVYRHASGEGNLLTFLHEKYTPGIERFLLFLLIPIVIVQTISIAVGQINPAVNMVLLVVMFGSGLQFIALTWRMMEKDLSKKNILTPTLVLISCLGLTLPFLGQILPLEIRIVVIILFTVVSATLAYSMDEEQKVSSLILACLVTGIFLGWGLIRLNILPSSSHSMFFNLPILATLTAGLFLCKKHGTMRAFLLISLGSYLFEYIL